MIILGALVFILLFFLFSTWSIGKMIEMYRGDDYNTPNYEETEDEEDFGPYFEGCKTPQEFDERIKLIRQGWRPASVRGSSKR